MCEMGLGRNRAAGPGIKGGEGRRERRQGTWKALLGTAKVGAASFTVAVGVGGWERGLAVIGWVLPFEVLEKK
jgi:hypothetical protein